MNLCKNLSMIKFDFFFNNKTISITNMFMRLRKRKLSQIPKNPIFSNKKNRNRLYTIGNEWVSASSVINHMMNDGIIDYFQFEDKELRKNSNINNNESQICYLSDILKVQGISFEDSVMNSFRKKFTNDYRSFITIARTQSDICDNSKYFETINAMESGIPFIYQAVLHDHEDKIYGSPDLLVRNDCIDVLCNNIKEPIPALTKTTHFGNYYYIVVDIKSSILRLRANGNNLLNYGRMVGYKGQLYIYHKILSKIQKFDSHKAFILGKGFTYIKSNEMHKGVGWFDRLGCINYNTIDYNIKNRVTDAIEWRRNIQTNYNNMTLYPVPSNENLYPNMCNRYDDRYRKRKRRLAEAISEHTLVSLVTVKHRKFAHSNQVYKFTDNDCNIDTLGITGDTTRKIVNTILKINQSDSQKITPIKIKTTMYNWRKISKKEAFVDFETIPLSILEQYNSENPHSIGYYGQVIYLIGIWYFNNDQKRWVYKTFISEKISIQHEHKIVKDFTDFVDNEKINKLYHWGKSAEPAMYTNSILRILQCSNNFKPIKYNMWHDLYTLFKNENIAIKGATSYGLKDIAQAMKINGMIKNYWRPGIFDGIETIALAWSINNELELNNYNKIIDDPRMNCIIEYNETDCKILHEIINYLRENH